MRTCAIFSTLAFLIHPMLQVCVESSSLFLRNTKSNTAPCRRDRPTRAKRGQARMGDYCVIIMLSSISRSCHINHFSHSSTSTALRYCSLSSQHARVGYSFRRVQQSRHLDIAKIHLRVLRHEFLHDILLIHLLRRWLPGSFLALIKLEC